MAVIPPLSFLLAVLTPAQIEAQLLAFLAAAGLPSTAWPAVSVPTLMVESNVTVDSALQNQVLQLGYGGYFQLASAPALQTGPGGTSPFVDLGAQQFFNLLRHQPQPTTGPLLFTAVVGAGPYSIRARQLKITDGAGNVYTNLAGFTLSGAGGPVAATCQAQSPGSQANIANTSTGLSLVTSLAGVSVSTFPPSGSPLWYTAPLTPSAADPGLAQAGADVQSDASLIAMCLNRWPGLGTGSPAGAVLNWVFAASNEVRYARASAVGNGAVRMTVWGNDGPVSSPGLAAVAAYASPRLAVSSFLAPGSPVNAGQVPVNPRSPPLTYAAIQVTLTGDPRVQTAAIAAVIQALALLVRGTPLGGYPIVPGSPDTYGVSNAFLVAACVNANSGITGAVVSVTNYVGGVVRGASGPGADLVMTPVAGVPVALQPPPTEDVTGWGIQPWRSV